MRALLALAALTTCADETVSGYAPKGVTWVAAEVNGATFPARATLTFPKKGKIAGEAPCNRYSAGQTAPYPWFDAEAIVATKMACPDLALEAAFLDALDRATLVEVAGETLLLSTEAGVVIAFRAE